MSFLSRLKNYLDSDRPIDGIIKDPVHINEVKDYAEEQFFLTGLFLSIVVAVIAVVVFVVSIPFQIIRLVWLSFDDE